jgi:hypothetical protein
VRRFVDLQRVTEGECHNERKDDVLPRLGPYRMASRVLAFTHGCIVLDYAQAEQSVLKLSSPTVIHHARGTKQQI